MKAKNLFSIGIILLLLSSVHVSAQSGSDFSAKKQEQTTVNLTNDSTYIPPIESSSIVELYNAQRGQQAILIGSPNSNNSTGKSAPLSNADKNSQVILPEEKSMHEKEVVPK